MFCAGRCGHRPLHFLIKRGIKNAFEYNTELGNWLKNFNGVATKYLNNYLMWFKFLFISKKYKEFNRIKELFMELSTGDLYITQYMIKNRFVELL